MRELLHNMCCADKSAYNVNSLPRHYEALAEAI